MKVLNRAAAGLLATVVSGIAYPQSVLESGSFEVGGAAPIGWQKTENVEMKRDTEVFHSAPASLCVISKGKDGNASQKVQSLAGKSVKLSGFVRREASLKSAQVFTLTFDKKWKSLGWNMILGIPAGDKWVRFEKTVTFPDNTGTVLFGLFASGEGRAWLDDAAVIPEGGGGQPEPYDTYKLEDLSRYKGPQPKVEHVGAVAAGILCIHVREFFGGGGSIGPYIAQPGDEVIAKKGNQRALNRGGKEIGTLGGPEGNVHLWVNDQRAGKPLQLRHALDPQNYEVVGRAGAAIKVERVFRKTRPVDHTAQGYCREHFLFPKLAQPLLEGGTYTLRFRNVNAEPSEIPFVFDTKSLRSEAVHVSQVGFRADDPAKLGFLSQWMGTGGASTGYKEGMPFHLVEVEKGEVTFSGKTALRARRTDKAYGLHHKDRNFELTDTFVCDFSAFDTPGEHVLSVEGVGCSYPFKIGEETWKEAWVTSMRGFYHQRSGIAWEKPYAAWERPRDLHPADGPHNTVYELSISELDFGTRLGDGKLQKLLEYKTDKTLPDAWGGYHDAGDYDRRQSHLVCSRMMMELFDLFPEYFRQQKLLLPENGNEIADVLDEALWCPSLYRRMQREDGAIRGGIETNGHPKQGEPSHLDTLTKMAFAPDVRASWALAATAAQAAYLLDREKQPTEAAEWQASALKAMEWAEREFGANRQKCEALKGWWGIRDLRNLAAVQLFRLTGDARWHRIFLETCGYRNQEEPISFLWTSHSQAEAAIVYARLENAEPTVREKARQALLNQAEFQIQYASKQAYMLTAKDLGSPLIISSHAAPRGLGLCRAHFLTGDKRYLEWAIKSSQFSVGSNPMNLVMTTGLGNRPARHPLYLDMKYMAKREPPPGITLYGIKDPKFGGWSWAFTWVLKHRNNCFPDFQQWPLSEFYFDVYAWAMQNEFTVQQSMAPAVYVWGYLAARK